MRVGVTGFVTDKSAPVTELVGQIADRGFESLYLPEHTHYPTATRSPVPGREDLLREEFRRFADPIVSLAIAATAEPRLHLGTGVLLVAQHDPIVLAKQLATIDLVAPGRLRLGVGYGWNEAEAANHGIEPADRRQRALEYIDVMRRLWADEVTRHTGAFVRLTDSLAWPKPAAPIPVLLAGRGGSRLFAEAVAHADGWMPLYRPGLRTPLARLHDAFERAGREVAPQTVVLGVPLDSDAVGEAAASGADEIVVRIDFSDQASACAGLDQLVAMLTSVGLR